MKMNINACKLFFSLLSSFFVKLCRDLLLPAGLFCVLITLLFHLLDSNFDIYDVIMACFLVVLIMFVHALGYLVSQDDFDSNAVLFLEALPVHKWTVFLARFAAAYLILILFVALTKVCWYIVSPGELFNKYDYWVGFRLDVFWVSGFGYLAITTFLASFPRISVILTVVFYFFLLLLIFLINKIFVNFIPTYSMLEMEGNVQLIWIFLILGLICLALSLLVFRIRVLRLIRGTQIKKSRKKLYIILGSVTAVVIVSILSIGLLIQNFHRRTESQVGVIKQQVGNLTVRFSGDDSTSIEGLLNELPKIDKGVRELIGEGVISEPIEITFTDELPSHAAGVMNGNIIRIGIKKSNDLDSLCRTIAHEIAHVYVENLTQSVASIRFSNEGQLLHEGCAEWIASQLYPEKDGLSSKFTSFRAALMWGNFQIDELFDNNDLSREWGKVAVYVLGNMFIESIVRAGEERCSLSDIFAAYIKSYEEAPEESFLWPQTLAKLNRNIPALEEHFYSQLNEFKNSHELLSRYFPKKPPVEYRRINGDIEFRLTQKLPDNYQALIELSKTNDGLFKELIYLKEGGNVLARSKGLRSSEMTARVFIKIAHHSKNLDIASSPYTLLNNENTAWLTLDYDSGNQ